MFTGNTSSNIGNAFFYEGVKHTINKIDPSAIIIEAPFPMKNAYKLSNKEFNNCLDYSLFISDIDYLILSGPILDLDFGLFFERILEQCDNLKIKTLFLSVGGRKYNSAEINHCSSLFTKFPPHIFVSRDLDTFNNYTEYCKNSYNGICFAFFVNDYFKGNKIHKKFICSAIDFTKEPEFIINKEDFAKSNLEIPKNIRTKSKINKIKFAFDRKKTSKINDFEIVRLHHRPLRKKYFLFHKVNSVVSHSHNVYLNFYKNSSLTITDRLHAAVATLAFGNPARLMLDSNRVKLLERAGLLECTEKIYTADLEKIEIEKNNMTNWIYGRISTDNK